MVKRKGGSRGRGRPVGADSARTRQRIVIAAREVLTERGYPSMTFQAIAKRTGLSRPTLRYYFSSREEIFKAVADGTRGVIAECVDKALEHDAFLDRLSAFLLAIQEADYEDRSVIAFLISARLEPQRNPELVRAVGESPVRTFLTGVVDDAIERGELAPNTEITAIVQMLHVILWGVGFYAGFVADPTDVRSITKQLIHLFAHGLVSPTREDTHRDTPRSVGARP